MTAKQIHELTTSELILALIMNDRQACIEVNSRRGLLTEEDAQDILR